MGFTLRRDEQVNEWVDWMPELNTRLDLTVKHREGLFSLSDDLLNRTVVRLMNRVSGYALKHRSRRPRPMLGALIWVERGLLTRRCHLHGLVERPEVCSAEHFAQAVERAWKAQPFAHSEMRIEAIRDLSSSLAYNAKSGWASDSLIYWHKTADERAWWRSASSEETC